MLAPAAERLDGLLLLQRRLQRRTAPAALIAANAKAAGQLGAESQHLFAAFLGGQMGCEAFTENYIKAKMVYHQLELKRQAALLMF